MECTKSIELLREFHDGMLGEADRAQVRAHLAACQPCAGVYQEIDLIVVTASILRGTEGITFPDEDALWRRMNLAKRIIH